MWKCLRIVQSKVCSEVKYFRAGYPVIYISAGKHFCCHKSSVWVWHKFYKFYLYPDILFIVDCVSGLLSEEFLQDDWGVDIAVSASQKAFALPPGLSFLSASEKALDMAKESNLRNFYFDIFDYVNNAQRGQTPFTPAVGIVNQLDKRLQKIKKEGLENFRNRYKQNTLYLREGLQKLGFNVLAETPTNCVTAVYTNDIDAYQVVQLMREKYNIEIAPSGGDLKHKLFRVGNFGAIQMKEIKYFLKSLDKVLKGL